VPYADKTCRRNRPVIETLRFFHYQLASRCHDVHIDRQPFAKLYNQEYTGGQSVQNSVIAA
jgi:hypothetical protein